MAQNIYVLCAGSHHETVTLLLFVLTMIAALGEELGWSGYALDPLQERWGALAASLFLGVVTALWHFVLLRQIGRDLPWIARQSFDIMASRVLNVWIYNNTGKSVFAVAVLHAMFNVSWQLFPVDGSHYDPQVTSLVTAGIVILILLVWKPRTLTR